MTRREVHFSNVLRSRFMALLIAAGSVWMMRNALVLGKVDPITDAMSVAFPVASSWVESASMSLWVNVGSVLLIAGLLIFINTSFNLLRTMSVLFAAIFVLSTAAIPEIGSQFGAHTLLALVCVPCLGLLYSLYNVRRSDRRIFLIFFLLGAGSMVSYAMLLYVPVFFIGLWQMRIMRLKKLLSALTGLLVPLWIVYGAGLLPFPEAWPEFYVTPPTDLGAQVPGGWPAVAGALLSAFLIVVMGAVNAFRFLGFNARMRAYNGFLILLSVATMVFAAVNFTNLPFYLMLLNVCLAFHVGHFFRITASRRGYIPVLIAMAAYVGLYFWSIDVY